MPIRIPTSISGKIAYLLAISVFSKEIFGYSVAGSVVDVYQLSLAGFGVLNAISSANAQRIGMVIITLLGTSALLLYNFGYSLNILIMQGTPAILIYIGFAALIERTSPEDLEAAYMNVCFAAAVFGLFQFALSLRDILVLIKVPGRLDSLTYEPSHYAIAISPAVYLSLRSMLTSKRLLMLKELVIILSLLCTVSFTALMILSFCMVLIGLKERVRLFFLGFLAMASFFYLNQELLPHEIRIRIEALEEWETGIEAKNLSIYSVASNWNVAVETLKKGRVLGNGFGGHEGAYEEEYGDLSARLGYRYGYNVRAAHSLFIRVFSEFGLLGAFFYLLWVQKGIRFAADPTRIWWILSATYLFGRVFKMGGFFDVGMPIFILAPLVYYGWRDRERLARVREVRENYS